MTFPGTRSEGTPLPPRVVIVGAGIAGLACAARLLDLSRERGRALDLTIMDSASRAGGVIATESRDGFLVEKGPDCFITEKPRALDLCRRLGLEDQVIGTNPECRRSFVLLRGRILPIPEGYQLMAPGRLWPFATTPILSLVGKLRAACDLILPRGAPRDDESLASFVRRRFGSEVHDDIYYEPDGAGFFRKTNNAGGLEGGITNGQPIVLRVAMKPISTLYNPKKSVDIETKEAFDATVERSDICTVPAAGVVGEAVIAFEMANAMMEKFGGDSLEEMKRNYDAYQASVRAF